MKEEIAPRRGIFFAPLTYLPHQIREPHNPVQALGVAWLLTFPFSILVAMVIAVVAPNASQPHFPFTGLDLFTRVVIFAPVVETLIMGVAILILRLVLPPTLVVLSTALLAGLAHSFSPGGVAVWGLVIWWPFLIFSTLFVVWRDRSLFAAFAMPALAHILHNFPTGALLASGINI